MRRRYDGRSGAAGPRRHSGRARRAPGAVHCRLKPTIACAGGRRREQRGDAVGRRRSAANSGLTRGGPSLGGAAGDMARRPSRPDVLVSQPAGSAGGARRSARVRDGRARRKRRDRRSGSLTRRIAVAAVADKRQRAGDRRRPGPGGVRSRPENDRRRCRSRPASRDQRRQRASASMPACEIARQADRPARPAPGCRRRRRVGNAARGSRPGAPAAARARPESAAISSGPALFGDLAGKGEGIAEIERDGLFGFDHRLKRPNSVLYLTLPMASGPMPTALCPQ